MFLQFKTLIEYVEKVSMNAGQIKIFFKEKTDFSLINSFAKSLQLSVFSSNKNEKYQTKICAGTIKNRMILINDKYIPSAEPGDRIKIFQLPKDLAKEKVFPISKADP